MEKKQIVFIEYIRVVACFLVMLVHASGKRIRDASKYTSKKYRSSFYS